MCVCVSVLVCVSGIVCNKIRVSISVCMRVLLCKMAEGEGDTRSSIKMREVEKEGGICKCHGLIKW